LASSVVIQFCFLTAKYDVFIIIQLLGLSEIKPSSAHCYRYIAIYRLYCLLLGLLTIKKILIVNFSKIND